MLITVSANVAGLYGSAEGSCGIHLRGKRGRCGWAQPEDHAPNVTGIEMIGAYDQMFALMREFLPRSAALELSLFSRSEYGRQQGTTRARKKS
jgi:hypothetical protein